MPSRALRRQGGLGLGLPRVSWGQAGGGLTEITFYFPVGFYSHAPPLFLPAGSAGGGFPGAEAAAGGGGAAAPAAAPDSGRGCGGGRGRGGARRRRVRARAPPPSPPLSALLPPSPQ